LLFTREKRHSPCLCFDNEHAGGADQDVIHVVSLEWYIVKRHESRPP
jgi:hypothetical protein